MGEEPFDDQAYGYTEGFKVMDGVTIFFCVERGLGRPGGLYVLIGW